MKQKQTAASTIIHLTLNSAPRISQHHLDKRLVIVRQKSAAS
jgi:hypothetical protein